MDIRKYFSFQGAKSSSNSEKDKKRKKANIESDDDDPLPRKNRKSRCLASDSDSDGEIFISSDKKKQKRKESKILPQNSKEKPIIKSEKALQHTSAVDFFSKSKTRNRKSLESNKKEKTVENHSDDEFMKTLSALDKGPSTKIKDKTPSKSINNKESKKNLSEDSRSSKHEQNIEVQKKQTISDRLKNGDEKKDSMQSHESKPSKGLASKLSSKLKNNMDEESPSKKIRFEKYEEKTPNKITPVKEKTTGNKAVNEANVISSEESIKTEILESVMTPEDKKKERSAAYMKYLQRSGPKNPGSKIIPEGKPNCLSGLTFVMTGVLDSLDRDETSELIKQYGGRVTQSISKNTSYLVVGEDAGISKLKKAQTIGTTTLTEDDLLNLIATKPGSTIASSKSKGEFKKDTVSTKKSVVSKNNNVPSLDSDPYSSGYSSMSQHSASSSDSPIQFPKLKLTSSTPETLMWVDKYQPTQVKNIIGQQGDNSNARKLLKWLKNWFSNQSGKKKLIKPSPWAKNDDGSFFKAALLSGPPGVGKTTTAYLVSKELGYDVVEMNASVTRSKKSLQQEIAELLSNQSLKGFTTGECSSMSRNHVLLMDEVDGMSGNEDRGGVAELILLIKNSKIPIICMCNDRNHPKIRSLANYCFDLRYHKIRVEQIRGAMMSVCFREGIKLKAEALDQIIINSKHDIRQVLHHLSVLSVDDKNLDSESVKKAAQSSKKEFKMGPWDVCQKVFSESDHKSMTIRDKESLFFQDYSIGPLFVQENYLKVSPHCAKGNPKKLLEQISKCANALADGDLVEHAIRQNNSWSLLPVQALYSSVLPGEYMAGHFSAQIEFPKWLGNNSKKKKFDRLAQELHSHMQLRISASKLDVLSDYTPRLQERILNPLIMEGSDGVSEAVVAMTSYDLLREDLESVLELSKWPHKKDPMTQIESKVKAAFTRALNKDNHLSPFAIVAVSKKRGGASYGDEEGDQEEFEEDDEKDDDITKDAMIKHGKSSKPSSSTESKSKGGKSTKRKK